MPADLRNEGYLLDMVQAAQLVLEFVGERSDLEFFDDDQRILQWAVVKQIEIIGEAASRVTKEYRDSLPDVPWGEMIGMRHRLVHDYSNINLRVVWDVVRNDLRPLIARLSPLIPEKPADEVG
jgi:uncharacterized protein with HEPN domain